MKSVIVHGVLALFGLGFAYQTWTRPAEDEHAPDMVTVAECRESELQKIVLDTENIKVTVEPQRQKDETLFWITTEKKPKKVDDAAKADDKKADDKKAEDSAKADAAKTGADAKPADEAKKAEEPKKPEEKPKRFLANAAFKEYLEKLTPLRANQSLGTLPKDKLADFGFDKVDTKVQIQCGAKPIALEVGARTFGSGQRYMRDEKSHAAWLFSDEVVADLQSAQFKFMQNDLHAFQPNDVVEATVEVRGSKKRLLQRDRKLEDRAQWVDAGAPDKRNELYGNWFNRLSKVRVREYLPQGAEPGSELEAGTGELTPSVRVDYKLEGKPDGKLELVRVQEGTAPAKYYARTETTRGWVTVFDSSAREVEQDAAMVVGLEEAPASKTAPTKDADKAPSDPHGGMPGLPSGHPPVGKDPHAH